MTHCSFSQNNQKQNGSKKTEKNFFLRRYVQMPSRESGSKRGSEVRELCGGTLMQLALPGLLSPGAIVWPPTPRLPNVQLGTGGVYECTAKTRWIYMYVPSPEVVTTLISLQKNLVLLNSCFTITWRSIQRGPRLSEMAASVFTGKHNGSKLLEVEVKRPLSELKKLLFKLLARIRKGKMEGERIPTKAITWACSKPI